MKKLISVFIILISSVFFYSMIKAAEATTLIVHYYRYDGGEGKQHVAWIWQNEPVETEYKVDHPFKPNPDPEMENWLILEVDLSVPEYKGMDSAGIIIKDGPGWDGIIREPGGDRIIEFSPQEIIDKETNEPIMVGGVKDGKLEVYFVQSNPEFYYRFEDVHIKNVIFDSYFTNDLNIYMETSATPLSYEVFEGDKSILKHTPTSQNFIIDLSGLMIDISKNYYVEVTFDDGTDKIKTSLSGLYTNPLFESVYHYDGELGALYTKEKTYTLNLTLTTPVVPGNADIYLIGNVNDWDKEFLLLLTCLLLTQPLLFCPFYHSQSIKITVKIVRLFFS